MVMVTFPSRPNSTFLSYTFPASASLATVVLIRAQFFWFVCFQMAKKDNVFQRLFTQTEKQQFNSTNHEIQCQNSRKYKKLNIDDLSWHSNLQVQ